MSARRPPFIDASYAAELLGVQARDVLDWVEAGRLSRFGGKDQNPFLRTAEVERLASELGVDLSRPPVRRRASQNPVRRVELRIRHDAKWSEISAEDITAWARELDQHTRAAARQVAETAMQRLNQVLQTLDGSSRGG